MDIPNDADDINIHPHEAGESAINRTGTRPVPTLFEIIGAFKSITTNRYINCVKQNNWPPFRKRLLQLKYHDLVLLYLLFLDRFPAPPGSQYRSGNIHPRTEYCRG